MAEIVDFGLQQHKIKMDSRYFENVLSVVAGDTGRRLEVQLLDTNGMVQDTTGLNLRLNALVAGKATFTDATLVDAATGKYQLDLSNGMFLAPGNWQFQWQITDTAGKKLHSFAFTGNIGKNISEGGSQATNFYLNLEDLKKMQDDLINGTIDSSVLETNIAEKLTNLETQYAPKLTEVTAQLAQTELEVLRKRELEDLSPTVISAIEGGEGTSFNLLSVPQNKSVTPEKTTFIQRGKNKFNGSYVKGIRLGGSIVDGSFVVLNTENAISVVFEGETGLTYTITRSLGSDYWGVGTFDHYPEVGEKPLRGLNENGVPWTSKAVSLQDGEKYIMISISSTGIVPNEFQIEEGTVATDYSEPNKVVVPIEKGSLTFDSLDKKTVSVTPDMTSFAQKGKNLFDGNFSNGLRLGGAYPNLAVSADATAKSVVFKGEKGKTYTLSRSTENDRYGVAVFTRQPAVGVAPIRNLADNTLPIWSEKTITLAGDEEYIMAFVSTTTPPELFQIEEGSVATSYSPVGAVKILLEDSSKLDEISTPKIHLVKSGNVINIYTPSKNDSSRYLCLTYERVTNANINTDSWLQTKSGVYRKSGDSYSLEFMLSTGGDQEGVLRVRGEADFIGGGVHGHEQNQYLSLLIDGKEYNISDNINTECSFVKIVQASTVYHNGTSVKAFQKYKASTWDLDKYTIDSKWIAEDETDIEVSKVGIFSVLKTDNGRTPIKWGRNDADFEKTDVSIDFKSSKLMTEKRADISWQELWGETENFYVNLKCEYDRNKYSGKHYVEDFVNRAKIYFDLGEFIMTAGDSVRYKNVLNFSF